MKKILTLIILYFFCIESNAQINDTAKYLIDSFQNKKQNFIGYPLSKYFKANRLKVCFYNDLFVKEETGDTLVFEKLSLRYFELSFTRVLDITNSTPTVDILLTSPAKVPKSFFSHNQKLDADTGWTRLKQNFWGQFIVADILVTGY